MVRSLRVLGCLPGNASGRAMHFDPTQSSSLPLLEPEQLRARLDAIRQALGADHAVVARRRPTTAGVAPGLELLAQCGPDGHRELPGAGMPVDVLGELLRGGRPVEAARPGVPWIGGWPLPSDRWPSVFVVAWSRRYRDPGAVRRRVAEAGMEALGRALAPPVWMTLGRSPSAATTAADGPDAEADGTGSEEHSLAASLARVERELLLRALRAADGNKSRAARELNLSRQGLYRKLRRHGLIAVRRRSRQGDTG